MNADPSGYGSTTLVIRHFFVLSIKIIICSARARDDSEITIPVAWALLPDKKASTYTMMWKELLKLVQLQPGTPHRLYMDFERAAWNAALVAMPWVQVLK
jgi:DNA primase